MGLFERHEFLYKSLARVREFFHSLGFLEATPPPLMDGLPGEPHVHPFELRSVKSQKNLGLYLHTSPEVWMKGLLAQGFQKIYSLGYVFRDDPPGPWHDRQFLMLEWYRQDEGYEAIMDDCLGLYKHLSGHPPRRWAIKTMREVFEDTLSVNLDELLEFSALREVCLSWELPGARGLHDWEDLFFLLFLNKVEPELRKFPSLILKEYPRALAHFSQLSPGDPRYALRFEWYLEGIEVANASQELTDANEQRQRSSKGLQKQRATYGHSPPPSQALYQALDAGIGHPSGGAIGLERLLKILF